MPGPTECAPYQELKNLLREAATLGSVGALVSWDQETYMPSAAGAHRSEQAALLSGLVHERKTSPRVGDLLAECESEPALRESEGAAANIREMRRDYDRAVRVPTELVSELARVGSLAQDVWKEARGKSDFAMFAPWLDRVMGLTRRKAEFLMATMPPGAELYDALLDEYEPGMTAAQIQATFTPLKVQLSGLVQAVAGSGHTVDVSVTKVQVPAARQHQLGTLVLGAMGFDLRAGRLDTTAHPFCSGIAPGDTRLTTRYTERGGFLEPLYGTMHEGGHGLYEQNLPKGDEFGLPSSEAVSLGIHESQSRMWENFVGRSRAFWQWALPKAKELFSPALDTCTLDQIHTAANQVSPSYIRVEADEATYNLHIMMRFELERAMIAGNLATGDLPGHWNDRFKQSFGLEVPDARRGCLQDVHWSFGLIGYFPTYTLGNLYAAQMWEKINADLPGLDDQMSRGDFSGLRSWLVENVHRHGRRYRAADLCRRITGRSLESGPLVRHLQGKVKATYGV
ncbi:MAG: carboxypeptidase M32 [Phycisphaerales bacterium]|nr:carboxypeptidase M32 [Phycisphaerales bacterium]